MFIKYGPFSLTIFIEFTWLKCFIALNNQAVTSAPRAGDKNLHFPHAPLVTGQDIHINSWVGGSQQFYESNQCASWVHVSYQSSLSYSLYYKDYTCSVCGSSCAVCWGRCRAKRKKKPSAGHHFRWQLVNKLKKRDAGTIFLPLSPPSRSLSPPLSLQTTGAFPKIVLEVMDFSGAWVGGRDISLKSGAQRRFCPPLRSIHTFQPLLSTAASSTYWNSLGWKVVRVRG